MIDPFLQAEGDRLKAGADLLGTLVVLVSRDTCVWLANKKACLTLGLEEDAIIGQRWFETFLSPTTRAETEAAFQEILSGRSEEATVTGDLVTKNNLPITVIWQLTPVTGQNGRESVAFSGHIITDTYHAQVARAKFSENEARYHSIYENTYEGMFQTRLDGTLVSGNPAAARILGYDSPEQMLAEVHDVGAEIYADPAERATFIQKLKADGKVESFEVRFRRRDKSVVWVALSAHIFNRESGILEGTVIEITDRKEAEEALRQNEQFLSSIIENIPDMIFIKEAPDLRYRLLNKAGEKLFGQLEENVLTKNDYDFFPQEQADFFTSKDRQVLQGHVLVDIPEEPIQTPEGERTLHTKKIPLLDPEGTPRYLLGISEDITERKQSEKKLQERLRFEEFIAQASSQLVTSPDIRTAIDSALSTLGNLMNLSRATVVSFDFDRAIASSSFEWCKAGLPTICERFPSFPLPPMQSFLDALSGGIATDFTNTATIPPELSQMKDILEMVGPRGTLGFPLRRNGKVAGVVVFAPESDSVQWDEGSKSLLSSFAQMVSSVLERHATEERLTTVLETVQDGITFSDEFGHFYIYNSEMTRLTGYTKAEAENRKDFHALVHADQEKAAGELNFLNNFEPDKHYESETVLVAKDGQRKYVLVSTITSLDNGRKFFLSAYRDITHLKEVEAALIAEKESVERQVEARTTQLHEALTTAESERDKNKTILESIGDAVFVLDPERRIVLINSVGAQLSGYTKEEMIGRPYREVLQFIREADGTENTEFIDRVYTTGQLSTMANHTALVAKDGSRIAVADSAAPLTDNQGAIVGCVVVFRDVSKERDIERMKDDFLSLASHQLRTPLTALRWQTQRLLSPKTGPLNDKQQDLATDLNYSVLRLISLVSDLLDITRLDSGTIQFQPKPTDLTALVRDVIKDVTPQFTEKNVHLTFNEVPLPLVNTDPELIRQVYQNLIVNACKYTPAGGAITVSLNLEENKVVSKVTDTGYGIPEEIRKHIFERFYRSGQSEIQESAGSGLGLYLAKRIVEAAGGTIDFTSQLGTGTTFWFTLLT